MTLANLQLATQSGVPEQQLRGQPSRHLHQREHGRTGQQQLDLPGRRGIRGQAELRQRRLGDPLQNGVGCALDACGGGIVPAVVAALHPHLLTVQAQG
jgi:hypothetical protein